MLSSTQPAKAKTSKKSCSRFSLEKQCLFSILMQTDWTVFLPSKNLLLLALLQQRHETDHKARLGQCTSIGFLRKPAAACPPVKVGLVVAVEPPLHKGPIEIRYFEGRAWGLRSS